MLVVLVYIWIRAAFALIRNPKNGQSVLLLTPTTDRMDEETVPRRHAAGVFRPWMAHRSHGATGLLREQTCSIGGSGGHK
jgi:hypothetical protein